MHAGAAAGLVVLLAAAGARAASTEFWPEFDFFYKFSRQARMLLVGEWTREKESTQRTFDVAGYADVTLPVFLKSEPDEFRKDKYLWFRTGFMHVFESDTKDPEERLIAAIYGRLDLPLEIKSELRLQVEPRWIGGDYSTRVRGRAEVNHDFDVAGHTVLPWVRAEEYWDGRYDGWSRFVFSVGAEIYLLEHVRFEPYYAHQHDRLPNDKTVNALGAVAKWYY